MLKLKSDFNMNLSVSESAQTRLSEEPRSGFNSDGTSKQTLETPHVLWQ